MGSVVNDQKMMEHLVPEGAEWGDNMRAACILINLIHCILIIDICILVNLVRVITKLLCAYS